MASQLEHMSLHGEEPLRPSAERVGFGTHDEHKEVVSLSSAEDEFYGAVKTAAAGIGCVSMLRDLGVVLHRQWVEVKAEGLGDGIDSPSLEVKLDATAGRDIATRRGWTYQAHRNPDAMVAAPGEIKMTRVGGHDNCAYLGTKHLDFQAMKKHLKSCGMRFHRGQKQDCASSGRKFTTLLPRMTSNVGTHVICSCMSGSPHCAIPRHDQWLELTFDY